MQNGVINSFSIDVKCNGFGLCSLRVPNLQSQFPDSRCREDRRQKTLSECVEMLFDN